MERRIVAQLISCMDSLSDRKDKKKSKDDDNNGSTDANAEGDAGPVESDAAELAEAFKSVVVIGATSTPDSLDSSLRRAGRFDREICMGIPDVAAREHIFRILIKKMRVPDDFNFRSIALRTPGYVGADLSALAKETAAAAVNRILEKMRRLRRQMGMRYDGRRKQVDCCPVFGRNRIQKTNLGCLQWKCATLR